MTRRLYNIAVVTSLVLFVVVMGLWIVSGFYTTVVCLNHTEEGDTVYIAQRSGTVSAGRGIIKVHRSEVLHSKRENRFTIFPQLKNGDTIWLGLGYGWVGNSGGVLVPHWLLAILTLILPVVWLIRRRRKRDPDAVPCAKCGYDLRGSPGGACPECGEGEGAAGG